MADGGSCDDVTTKANSAVRSAETESSFTDEVGAAISTYPNPFRDQLSIRMKVENEGSHLIIIHDLFGRKVYENQVEASFGEIDQQINTSNMVNGTYLMTISSRDDDFRTTVRIIKR